MACHQAIQEPSADPLAAIILRRGCVVKLGHRLTTFRSTLLSFLKIIGGSPSAALSAYPWTRRSAPCTQTHSTTSLRTGDGTTCRLMGSLELLGCCRNAESSRLHEFDFSELEGEVADSHSVAAVSTSLAAYNSAIGLKFSRRRSYQRPVRGCPIDW